MKFEMGKLLIPAGNPIFKPAKVYMKDICSITVTAPAKGIMDWQGNTVMAVAHVGKGLVFATVDPWFYNEYTDGRHLPPEFRNFEAAGEFTGWLVEQADKRK
jgi:unsaturated rhamnogalacturonyl hydrolase